MRAVERNGHYAVVATAALPAGAAVLFVDGDVVERASRYSIQIGVDLHVDVPPQCPAEPNGSHLWRFLNHSCDANAVLHERMLVASRPIAAGEEVTFDYECNEWELAEPFRCRCGAAACRREIRGHRHLDAATRAAIAPFLSPHIALASDSR